MDPWFIIITITITIIITLCISGVINSTISRRSSGNSGNKPPPGPPFLRSTYLQLTTSPLNLEPILINLKERYGPLFTLTTGVQTTIFIGAHSLAHQLLVQKGAIFSDRPKSVITRTIATSPYGVTWRTLRRNLAGEVLHPHRIRSYSWVRKWVLQILINRIEKQREIDGSEGIKVGEHFQYAVFCLLVFMCFGEKLDETKINEIVKIQRGLQLNFASGRFSVLTVVPILGKLLFRNRWKEFEKSKSERDEAFVPLIKSRIGSVNSINSINSELRSENERVVAYVDTLVNLQLPEEDSGDGDGGRLTYEQMARLCSEFLNAGTDTTATALQWIMANLVKNPHIQKKLYDEIVTVVGAPPELSPELIVNEDDLNKMCYLKAVVLEGLRRHPPVHLLLPHRVMKEVEVQGYMIPEGAIINFMVGEMGLDPKVWDEPMEFRPERFLEGEGRDGGFDITGSRGIKMMPFGAGRRMCPGYDLALLHLEYFVANLVWYYEWSVADGCCVDLSKKTEFIVVMKNPLRARVSSRAKKVST